MILSRNIAGFTWELANPDKAEIISALENSVTPIPPGIMAITPINKPPTKPMEATKGDTAAPKE